MDRQIVYPGQILPETTLLQMTKDTMIGSAKLAAAMLGTSTIANGFAVTPTGPASLQVVVAPGEIYALTSVDALAFSTLPADTTHSILKQGVLLDGVTLSCPAPTTTGQSINYLVQVTYQDQDSTPVLLPYYNSANPAMPYSGMGNNGLTQNTSRKGAAIVQVKAGASAATGSQTTPAPDSGYAGIYIVTVAYGQTTITSSSISRYAYAPLLPSGLVQSIQTGNMSFAVDTGSAGAYVGAFSPVITSRIEGQIIRMKAKLANTGASTIDDGLGPVALVGGAHSPLQGGEIVPNGDLWAQWNSSIGGGSYILLLCTGAPEQIASATQSQHAVNAGQIQSQSVTAVQSVGGPVSYTVYPSPPVTAYAQNQRFRVAFNVGGSPSPTLSFSGLTPKSLKQYNSAGSKVSAIVAAGQLTDVEYDGTDIVLLDPLPVLTQATESTVGSAAVATQAMVSAGVDDATMVPPKKLAAAVQTQALVAFTTAGTSPALTLTPSPAIPGYSAGLRFRVKFSAASTGADTLNISGFGVRNLKQYSASGSKVPAVFVSGQLADVEFDGTDIVILNPLLSMNQATESLLGGGFVASQTTTNAGSNDTNFITPLKLFTWAASGITAAAETVFGFAKVATKAITDTGTDDTTIVTPKKLRGGASWLLATNGYLALPSWLGGIIINWGRVTVAYDASSTVNFSMNYASSIFVAYASVNTSTTSPNGSYSAYANAISNSQVTISNDGNVSSGSTSQLISWLTIGI
jgi:hypothetical protein